MAKKDKIIKTQISEDDFHRNTITWRNDDIYELMNKNEIYIDPRLQRRDSWKNSDIESYITSSYEGKVSSFITLLNIKNSSRDARENGNIIDANYFDNLLEKGYKYISIDGNNRSKSIFKYLNGDLDLIYKYDQTKKIFEKKRVDVSVFTADVKFMHELALQINQGQKWVPQEDRNCMISEMGDYVREVSPQCRPFMLKMNALKVERMGDDELIATMCYYALTNKGSNQKNLNEMYKTMTPNGKVRSCINIWKNIMLHYSKVKNLNKTFSFNLFILIKFLEDNNVKIDKEKYRGFANDFLLSEEYRKEDKLSKFTVGDKELSWEDLCRNVSKNSNIKLYKIIEDSIDIINKYGIKVDSKRLFNQSQIFQIFQRDGCVYVNKNKKIEQDYIDVIGMGVEVDHHLPHSKGGKTEVSNGKLLTKEYNRSKSDKIID